LNAQAGKLKMFAESDRFGSVGHSSAA
jgi:hypothetical protein